MPIDCLELEEEKIRDIFKREGLMNQQVLNFNILLIASELCKLKDCEFLHKALPRFCYKYHTNKKIQVIVINCNKKKERRLRIVYVYNINQPINTTSIEMFGRLFRKIRYLDIFGQQVMLNFNEDNQIQTTFGGSIAVLIGVVVFVFFYMKSTDFLAKGMFGLFRKYWKRKETFFMVFFDDPSEIKLDYNRFMISVNMNQNDFLTNPYFNITLQQRVYTMLPNGTQAKQFIDIQLEPCTFQHWDSLNRVNDIIMSKEQFKQYNISSYLCPKYGTNLTVGGQIQSDVFKHLKFTITKCTNQTQNSPNLWKPVCPSIADQNKYVQTTSTIRVQFQIANYIINPTQVGQFKTRYVANDLFFQLQPQYLYKTADIYMTENVLEEDVSLYPYSDFKEDSVAVQQYGDYREQYTVGNNTVYGAFFFNRSRFQQQYSIQYQKVDDLISQIGGFVQSVMVIAGILVGFYNQEYYTIELANQIYDFDIIDKSNNSGGGSGKSDSSIQKDRDKTNTKSLLNNTLQVPINESLNPGDKILKLTRMLTQKKTDKVVKQSTIINTNASPNMNYSLSPNIQIKQVESERPSLKLNNMNVQLNDLSPTGINDKTSINNNDKSHTFQHNITNSNNNMMKNNIKQLNANANVNPNPFTSNIKQESNSLPKNSITNALSLNKQITSFNAKQNSNKNTNGILNTDSNVKALNLSKNMSKQNTDELNKLLNWNPPLLSPKQPLDSQRKKQKRVESAACQPTYCKTTNDVVRYSTISPLSLTQIDKRLLVQQPSSLIERQLTSSDENNQIKQSNLSPQEYTLSPPNLASNPMLFNITDRHQNEKNSLICFDSSIEPESSLDISEAGDIPLPSPQRKDRSTIFRTLQPQINGLKKFEKEKMFRVKSFTDIGDIKEMNNKECHSFKSLRDAKTQASDNKQIHEIAQKNFLNAYHEEMRKDFMSRQLKSVLQKRQKLHLSLKYFIFRLTCGKLFCTKEHLLIQRANDFLQKDVDIIVILNKLKELEKLKCLLLDQNQLTLFNYFPKPLLEVDKNKNIAIKKEEKLREVKQFEQKLKNLNINPKHMNIVKKAKDRFKGMLNSKSTNDKDLIQNDALLYNMNQHQLSDYQKLYKAYEDIVNRKEASRMDNILVKNLGDETKKIFQDSLQMQFGMDKLVNLMGKSTSKSQQLQSKNK